MKYKNNKRAAAGGSAKTASTKMLKLILFVLGALLMNGASAVDLGALDKKLKKS